MASSSESAGKSSQSADSPSQVRANRPKTSKKRPNETDEGMERISIENNNVLKESIGKDEKTINADKRKSVENQTNTTTTTIVSKHKRKSSKSSEHDTEQQQQQQQPPFTDLLNSDPPSDNLNTSFEKKKSTASKHKRKSSKSSEHDSPSLKRSGAKLEDLESEPQTSTSNSPMIDHHGHGHDGEPQSLRHAHNSEMKINEHQPAKKLTLRAKFMKLVGLGDKTESDKV